MGIYIIAEAGVNHNGSVDLAKSLIDAAVYAGADAVKFQTFIADELVAPKAPKADYQKNTTDGGESQYDMLKKLELPRELYPDLIKYSEMRNIEFLSTPFDNESADFLENLGMMKFKIPSGELTNHALLKHIASKGKEVVLSTGMANEAEVEAAVRVIAETGNLNLTLLECTSCYPARFEDINLNGIVYLRERFGLKSGFSDHSPGTEAAVAAVALGATIIEKHFTIDKSLPGPDHRMSLSPEELKLMVMQIRNVEKALGVKCKKPAFSEKNTAEVARRSIYYIRDMGVGEPLNEGDVEMKRPGTGISPDQLDSFIGKRLMREVFAGVMLKHRDFDDMN